MNAPTTVALTRGQQRSSTSAPDSARRTALEINAALDAKFMLFSGVQAIVEELELSLATSKHGGTPRHLAILGPSGVGKTALLHYFLRRHPRVEEEERTFIPVLLAQMPATPTRIRILQALVAAFDPKLVVNKDEAKLTSQVQTLCDACGVRMVLFDESSHMVDRGRERTHYLVGDALKTIVDELGRPFVLVGIPRLKRLLDVNEQLRGRFSRHRTLQPFTLADPGQAREFRGAVAGFAEEIKGIECIELTGEQVLPLLYLSCNGYLRPMVDLLKEAVNLALKKRGGVISMTTLAVAFSGALGEGLADCRNPFSPSFDGYPLINEGEPYAPTERG